MVIDVWKRLNGMYKIGRLTSICCERHFFSPVPGGQNYAGGDFPTNYFSFMAITPLFEGPWRKTVYHGFEQNSGFFPILNLRPLCHALFRFWVQLEKTNFFTEKYIVIDVWKRLNGVYKM